MAISGVSTLLQDAMNKVLEQVSSRALFIDCVFSDGLSYKFTPDYINRLTIGQDFLNKYTDYIELELEIPTSDYISLTEHYGGLFCELKFYYADPASASILEPYTTIKQRAIIIDREDLTKTMSIADLVPPTIKEKASISASVGKAVYDYQFSSTRVVKIQLIDDKIYKIRKRRAGFILRDETTTSAIMLMAKQMDIATVNMVKADNTKKYKNLVIPPLTSFKDAFDYIQSGPGMGVYEQGFSYYFTKDTLYIYPAYSTDPTSVKTVHVFNVGPGKLAGCHGYDTTIATERFIIANGQVTTVNLQESSLENEGNAIHLIKGERIVSDWVKEHNKGFSILPKVNTETVYMDTGNAGMIRDKTVSPSYAISFDNPYVIKSRLASANRELVSFQWQQAVPFSFLPGGKVVYYYDGPNILNKKNGICEEVIYDIQRSDRLKRQMYTCVAFVRLSVAPN